MNASRNLSADHVVVQAESDQWVSVQSERFELASPGEHPLALALSSKWPVLSLASVEGKYAEVSLYRDGKLAGLSVRGPAVPARPEAAPVDAAWLAEQGKVSPELVGASLGSAERILSLVGLADDGLRNLFDRMPLEDLPPESFLVLR